MLMTVLVVLLVLALLGGGWGHYNGNAAVAWPGGLLGVVLIVLLVLALMGRI